MTEGYRIVVWLTDDELRACFNQEEGLLRRRLSDNLSNVINKINLDAKKHYLEDKS